MRFSICVVVFFCILTFPREGFSQAGRPGLSELYRLVDRTDSLADGKQKTFYLEKFLKDDYNYRETWRFSENGGRIVYFQVDYIIDSTEFTEVYYVNRGNLICSEEYEKVNYSVKEDELKYGSIYYFESTQPKHVVTLGARSFANRMERPESTVFSRFQKRYSELKRHLPMLP